MFYEWKMERGEVILRGISKLPSCCSTVALSTTLSPARARMGRSMLADRREITSDLPTALFYPSLHDSNVVAFLLGCLVIFTPPPFNSIFVISSVVVIPACQLPCLLLLI